MPLAIACTGLSIRIKCGATSTDTAGCSSILLLTCDMISVGHKKLAPTAITAAEMFPLIERTIIGDVHIALADITLISNGDITSTKTRIGDPAEP